MRYADPPQKKLLLISAKTSRVQSAGKRVAREKRGKADSVK